MKEKAPESESLELRKHLKATGIASQLVILLVITTGYFAFNNEMHWQRVVGVPLLYLLGMPIFSTFMFQVVTWAHLPLIEVLDSKADLTSLAPEKELKVLKAITDAPWIIASATVCVWMICGTVSFYYLERLTPGRQHHYIDLFLAVAACMPAVFLGQVLRIELLLKPYFGRVRSSTRPDSIKLPLALSVRKRLMISTLLIGPYSTLIVAIFTYRQFAACTNLAEALHRFWPLQVFFVSVSSVVAMLLAWYLGRIIDRPLEQIRKALTSPDSSTTMDTFDEFGVISHLLIERRQLESAKQEFFAVVSHELRSPLMAIQSFLGMVADGVYGDLPSRVRKKAATAESNAERLIRLINDILDAEKLQSGKFDCIFDTTTADVVLDRSVKAVMELAESHNVPISIQSCDEEIVCDEERMMQVLVNFLTNAIKNADGKEVFASATRNGDTIEFGVRDQGAGIPVDMQQQVFEKFKQLKTQSGEKVKGTGLGLPISKALVEQHGGSIGVDSTPGEGSYFFARIPLRPPEGLFAALKVGAQNANTSQAKL